MATGISFSRYSTTLTNSGAESSTPTVPDIEFATWVIDCKAVFLDNIKLPGDSMDIEVWVRNWENSGMEKISGYNQAVNLELQTTGNLPLEFTLKENGTGPDLFSANYGPNSYISDVLTFTAGEKETKEFTLTVTWPENKNDELYKNEIDYLQLGLRAEQN